jgi:4-hydroxybenzoyl-CoA reductase subunit alpha
MKSRICEIRRYTMAEYSVVGKRTPRTDTLPMVTGEAKYAVDVMLPGMLYGKVLYSPYPHAKILNIDTRKAERLPGVKAIITGKDTPGKAYAFPFGPLPAKKDTYVLTTDKVRYIGDALAAVAAIDEDTAEEALDLIEVEYEILPALCSLEEAMQPGAIKIHDHSEQNILHSRVDGYGDVEKGFQESDYIREDTFRFPMTSYMQPEPQGCVASYDTASGRFTFWAGAAWAYLFRSSLALMLDIPYHRIKIITPYAGGSFGGRGTWIYPSHLCAALLSQKTGRPVKIVNTREEEFIHRCANHQTVLTLKTGVKKDGTIVARDATVIYDIGAYSGMEASLGTISNACWFHAPFQVPNLKAKLVMVFTNKPPHGPFRSYGNLQPIIACELQMDLIARDLGIDPADIRMKASVKSNTKTPFGWEIKSCGLKECMEEVSKAINWKERVKDLPANYGKGFGTAMFNSPRGGTPENPLSASVIINSDGTADLLTLGTESGSGQYFAMRMIVAEELGIPLENVKKPAVDTDLSLERENICLVTISVMGRAPQKATFNAKQMILEVIANKMEANVEDLECKNGRVYIKGSPEKGMSFAEAAQIAIAEKGSIIGRGEYISPSWERGADHVNELFYRFGVYGDAAGHGYGVAGAEVKIDRETGKVRILRLATAYDVGFALNPLAVEGQLEGGVAISTGALLTEEVLLDNGQILNPSYLNYRMLTSLDMPEVIPIIVETENDPNEGPFGAKELGMGVIGSPGTAVISAIYNATGVMLKEFPATPERILKALEV